jgi:hypothetical protein
MYLINDLLGGVGPRAAVPAVLPSAQPSPSLIRSYTRLSHSKERREIVWLIRWCAIHEAAHAFVFAQMPFVKIKHVAIVPASDAHLSIAISPQRTRTSANTLTRVSANALARGALAGPIAQLMATPKQLASLRLLTYASEEDLKAAVGYLRASGATADEVDVQFAKLLTQTLMQIAKPSMWRKIVAIADELIARHRIPGRDVIALVQTSRGKGHVSGLDEAALRVGRMTFT